MKLNRRSKGDFKGEKRESSGKSTHACYVELSKSTTALHFSQRIRASCAHWRVLLKAGTRVGESSIVAEKVDGLN